MHVHAVRFGRSSVIAGHIFMMIKGFGVVAIVMIIMMVRIQSNSVDGIDRDRIFLMRMGMSRRSRDEAIACKGKRQAEANEAPDERHDLRLKANCCSLLKSYC